MREDLDNPSTNRGFSRRDFVRASIGSGFAAAVLPVTAQTVIKTDSVGLLAGEEEERAAGDEPGLGEALEGVKVDAEVGIALRGFKGVQAQNALAATAARE